MAARTWAQTWLKPEVRTPPAGSRALRVSRRAAGAHPVLRVQAYPIFVAIGAACVMCVGQCGRQLLSSPDVRITKSERALGVLEDKRFTKEGAEFREHSLRRCGPGAPFSCAARGGSGALRVSPAPIPASCAARRP
jgi:hypothetical protein